MASGEQQAGEEGNRGITVDAKPRIRPPVYRASIGPGGSFSRPLSGQVLPGVVLTPPLGTGPAVREEGTLIPPMEALEGLEVTDHTHHPLYGGYLQDLTKVTNAPIAANAPIGGEPSKTSRSLGGGDNGGIGGAAQLRGPGLPEPSQP